jgi:hypothetical protein
LEDAKAVQDLLVEAPAGVYRTWETAIREHCPDEFQERALIHTWQSGAGVMDKNRLQKFLSTNDPCRPRILLMNVEAHSRAGEAREVAQIFLNNPARTNMMAIDESTIVKNPSAKRTKFINGKLAKLVVWKRILCGLATPRSPLDLFSQFEFLNWEILGFRSYYAFRARYAVMKPMWFGGRKVAVVEGYQHQEELQALIAPHSFRVEFRPKIPSTYTIREVTLTPQQQKAYDEIKAFATTEIAAGAHVSPTVVITQILRLHQILCGHVKDDMGSEHALPENKTKELLELLEEYHGKAVIWCSYDADIQKLTAALENEYGTGCVARFWGGNKNTREDEEKRFLLFSSSCRFMLATPSAGGRGRTWTVADLVVYYSSTNNLEHRDQSEQRVQGEEKNRPVDYVDLIAPGTVETKILEALRAKINMAAVINGDTWRQWLI